jgi:hypothetical protein
MTAMTAETKTTLAALVVQHVKGECLFLGEQEREEWSHGERQAPRVYAWQVTLRAFGRQLTVPYYCGLGHTQRGLNGKTVAKPPSLAEVVDCLLTDARSLEGTTCFEDWARELGFSEDSRSAERTYHEVQRLTLRVKRFLGDRYEAFTQAECL